MKRKRTALLLAIGLSMTAVLSTACGNSGAASPAAEAEQAAEKTEQEQQAEEPSEAEQTESPSMTANLSTWITWDGVSTP